MLAVHILNESDEDNQFVFLPITEISKSVLSAIILQLMLIQYSLINY